MKIIPLAAILLALGLILPGCKSTTHPVEISQINPIPVEERELYSTRQATVYNPADQGLPKYDYTLDAGPFGVDLKVAGVGDNEQIVLSRDVGGPKVVLRDVQTGARNGLWINRLEGETPFETFIPFKESWGLVSVRSAPENLQTITLEWDPVPSHGDIYGYRIYLGLESGKYFRSYDVAPSDNKLVIAISPNTEYFVACTTFNNAGFESDPGEEITVKIF